MLAIIDYKAGNLTSVVKALDALGQLMREAIHDEPADVDIESLEAMLDHPLLGSSVSGPVAVPAL